MTAMLVCAAHSPLMNYLQPDAAVEQPILEAMRDLSHRVRAFDPELVVVFGPDHFAGFFYDLMPRSVSAYARRQWGTSASQAMGDPFAFPRTWPSAWFRPFTRAV